MYNSSSHDVQQQVCIQHLIVHLIHLCSIFLYRLGVDERWSKHLATLCHLFALLVTTAGSVCCGKGVLKQKKNMIVIARVVVFCLIGSVLDSPHDGRNGPGGSQSWVAHCS